MVKHMNQNSERYQLLDSKGKPVAEGWLENSPDSDELWVRVPEDRIFSVLEHEQVWLTKEFGSAPKLFGYVIRHHNGIIYLNQQESGRSMRQNLRIPICFNTFVYPVDDSWTGRRKVVSYDLSCGGIAFFCDSSFKMGEEFEIVIPMTFKPLLIRCEILRQKTMDDGQMMYAAKFSDLCDEEEAMVCEAVFSIQIGQSKQ